MKKILLSLYMFTCSVLCSSGHCLVTELSKDLSISRYVSVLNDNEFGKLLINTIDNYLINSDLSVAFELSNETRFEPNDGKKLKIFINTRDIEEPVFSETPGEKVFKITTTYQLLRHVSSDTSTFDEVLFHELLHLKHYLEELFGKATLSNRATVGVIRPIEDFAKIKYFEAIYMGCNYIQVGERIYFPELAAEPIIRILRHVHNMNELPRNNLWDSFEERRTVCGPDLNGLTENVYRNSKGRPPRYIYQGAHVKFFELADVIKDCTGSVIGSKKADVSDTDIEYAVSCIRHIYGSNKKLKARP